MRKDNGKTEIIAFDLDDVLCVRDDVEGAVKKYLTCKPIQEMIEICNKCYDDGYEIVIYTARGMTSFKGNHHEVYDNLFELTKQQLIDWGVKYHKLIMGKAHYDLLIDDKASFSGDICEISDVRRALAGRR